jgi:glutathione S-transferase
MVRSRIFRSRPRFCAQARVLRKCPRLRALHDEVFSRPNIERYLASDRRLAFNNDGIFRQYPELDG